MDTNKTLDLTGMSDYEIATIKQGYEYFINGKDFRYFGAILNKKDLKRVNRAFNYTDTRSWISGAIVGAAAVGFYEVYKRSKKKKAEVKEEN